MEELLEIVDQLNKSTLGWGAIIALLLSCIQISPVKINPWSFIAKHIGRALNGEMLARVDNIDSSFDSIRKDIRELELRVNEIGRKNDEDRAVTARVRILRFNDELLAEKGHSKESFDQVLGDIDVYENYCKVHPEFLNNKSVMSIRNIKKTYQKRMEKHDFLVNGED